MSHSRRSPLLVIASLVGAVSFVACHQPAAQVTPPPPLPTAQLAQPVITAPSAAALTMTDTAREVHVDIDTHNRDQDIRPLLDFVASAGHYTLVYPPNMNRKVRISMNNVPVSRALQTLLSLADLTLETTTPGAKLPGIPSVVFYELPVNVDSLSAEAIMKRYGNGRAIADLIVAGRQRP